MKIYLYPIWIRLWHWLNALICLLLIFTGAAIHYPDAPLFLLKFETAVWVHNIASIALIVLYLWYVLFSLFTGNIKNYIPTRKFISGSWKQFKFYFVGIFYKDRSPFLISKEAKFDPLKKIFYGFLIFFFYPVVIVSGVLLWYSHQLPTEMLGVGSIWLMTILHLVSGFIISIMVVMHIYFATNGRTATELTKAMITGNYEREEEQVEEEEYERFKVFRRSPGRLFPSSFYNPFTLTGGLLAIFSFTIFIFLFIYETISELHNPYLGIFTFIIVPSILVLGIALIVLGIVRESRKIALNERERKLPVIDFNKQTHRKAFFIFIFSAVIIMVFTTFGSFKAYEYSESDEFCGTVCHVVMSPEYVTYNRSPHSRVGCVECHIGSGATWFIKSKLSGAYQVYAVLADVYPTPIETPVENLRPSRETCEHCHWPRHFYDEKTISRSYFLNDRENTEYKIDMSIKVGGGNVETGNTSGIHWHMYLANDIEYYHEDRKRHDIPWVRSVNKITGEETIYTLEGFDMSREEMENTERLRQFDCMDCHNRPAHTINPTPQIVNLYMAMGKIDPDIPFIKQASVQALESHIESHDQAYNSIRNFVWNFYRYKLDSIDQQMENKINKAVRELSDIYRVNYFPQMKVSWKVYQHNIGHLYSPGCFRCHDGNHKSPDGKVITNDCDACHTFKSEIVPGTDGVSSTVENRFIHPGGNTEEAIKTNCLVCHGLQTEPELKKKIINSRKVTTKD